MPVFSADPSVGSARSNTAGAPHSPLRSLRDRFAWERQAERADCHTDRMDCETDGQVAEIGCVRRMGDDPSHHSRDSDQAEQNEQNAQHLQYKLHFSLHLNLTMPVRRATTSESP